MTGMPAHNRGKKMIPGVGYRFPPQPKRTRRACACGQPGNYFYANGEVWCRRCESRRSPEGILTLLGSKPDAAPAG